MGNSNSQVASQQSSITVPVWKGTWSSSNIPFVYGTFQLNYYDKFHTVPNGTSEIDVTINYATFSLYRPGAIINVKFDLDIKNTEDKIKFWSIFGGIPKYYELVEILKPNSFNKFVDLIFLHNYKSMLDEGKTILISEFGGEYKSYYSVIEAIAEGKTKISEIATKFNNDINSANRYADLIRKEYRLVNRVESIIGKKGLYQIENNFLSFWFNFIKRYESYYEQGKVNNISDFFKENFDSYVGKLFEKFCFIFVKEHLPPTFSFTKIGKQWGKIPSAPKDKNQYEIDICAINKKDKEILFAECKWKDKVNVDEVLKDLVEKSKHVQWNNGKRNESYAIFAKSFNKKIKEFNGKKIYCFDLKDMENLFKQT